jgi:hypothetical protein
MSKFAATVSGTVMGLAIVSSALLGPLSTTDGSPWDSTKPKPAPAAPQVPGSGSLISAAG